MDYASRLAWLRARMRDHSAAAILLAHQPALRWACGFTGSNGLLLVGASEADFITDGRYGRQAQEEVVGATVHVPGYKLFEHAVEQALLPQSGGVLFEPEAVSVRALERWRDQAPGPTFTPVADLLAEARAVKSAPELERLERAQAITEAVFEHVLSVLRPGLTERAVAATIVYEHLCRGAERTSFDPVVAAGPHGALPHARPTDRPLQHGDLVVIDMGGVYEGYASDMTRTLAIGEPPAQARRVYELVREAQEAALAAARGGIASNVLDAAARMPIEAAGYGEAFPHSLGHGIGLDTHEWPRVSYAVEYPLPEGAVVTIEPGIYLPDQFGVRIEDVVALEAGGCRNLTSAPKELIVL